MLVIKDGDQRLHVINYLAVVICIKAYPLEGVFIILESLSGNKERLEWEAGCSKWNNLLNDLLSESCVHIFTCVHLQQLRRAIILFIVPFQLWLNNFYPTPSLPLFKQIAAASRGGVLINYEKNGKIKFFGYLLPKLGRPESAKTHEAAQLIHIQLPNRPASGAGTRNSPEAAPFI